MSFTIFDIPEFIETTAQHLNKKDLSQCVLVNKVWHEQFRKYLWRKLTVSHLISYLKPNKRVDAIRAIHKYGHHTRTATAYSFRALEILESDTVTNLTELELFCTTEGLDFFIDPDLELPAYCHANRLSTLIQVLSRNPRLRRVYIEVHAYVTNLETLYETLAQLPLLEDLGLRIMKDDQSSQECLHMLMDSCTMLKNLTLDALSDDSSWERNGTNCHHQPTGITRLEFHTWPWCNYRQFITSIIRRCPDLRSIRLPSDCTDDDVEQIATLIQECCPNLEAVSLLVGSGVSCEGFRCLFESVLQLKEFTASHHPWQYDCDLASVIIETGHYKHLESIQLLLMKDDAVLDRRRLILLLQQCSNLRVFKSDVFVFVEELVNSDWGCRGLESLELEVLVNAEQRKEVAVIYHRKYQEIFFKHLCQKVRQLRRLVLQSKESVTWSDRILTFDMSEDSGLEQLRGLKNLEHLKVGK